MSRWGDLADWRPTSAHGGAMQEYRGLVLHIAEGYYEGTISWQQNPANQVSSHFVAGRDSGELAQLVDTDVTAWTQRAGNGHWLSLECAGFTLSNPLHKPGWELMTPWQIQCAADLLVRMHHQYGTPIQLAVSASGTGLGHHSMGGVPWGHLECPGLPIIHQKPSIITLAKNLVNPVGEITVSAVVQGIMDVLEQASNASLPDGDPNKKPTTQEGRNAVVFLRRILTPIVTDIVKPVVP